MSLFHSHPLNSLEGRVAFVTGAGSGIGRATALRMVQGGAKVGCFDLSDSDLQDAMRDIKHAGGTAMPLVGDVSQPGEISAAVDRLAKEYGRLDIVFANAGINGVWAPIEELTPEDWARTIGTNLTGTFLTIKYAAPYLKKHGGSVIVTSSVNGNRIFSNTGATAYSTTKAGQVAMTKMLALELARDKVRVNAVCPGAIETNISESTEQRDTDKVKVPVVYPKGKHLIDDGVGTAEQVAELVYFLATDASSHITGSVIFIDGAESLLQG